MTRPWVRGEVHGCIDAVRIAVDIAHKGSKLLIRRDKLRTEPVFEDWSTRPVSPVERSGEDGLEVSQCLRDLPLRELQDEVEVVVHQAERQRVDAVAVAHAGERAHEMTTIAVVMEQQPSLGASCIDVVDAHLWVLPDWSRHGPNL